MSLLISPPPAHPYSQFLSNTYSFMFKGLRVNLYSFACSDSGIPSWFQTSDVVCLLTSIGRVACGSIEEVGRGAQGCHARVSVAIHAIGDRAVATLLRGGAGDITVRGHTACTPTETYGRGKRGRYGERIGVRGVAEGRKKKPKGPTCNAAKCSFPYMANGHSNKSQKKFTKNLRQHMAEQRKP